MVEIGSTMEDDYCGTMPDFSGIQLRAADWDAALARWRQLPTDPGAAYAKELTLDAATLEPMVTFGTNPGMGIPISGAISYVLMRLLEAIGLVTP